MKHLDNLIARAHPPTPPPRTFTARIAESTRSFDRFDTVATAGVEVHCWRRIDDDIDGAVDWKCCDCGRLVNDCSVEAIFTHRCLSLEPRRSWWRRLLAWLNEGEPPQPYRPQPCEPVAFGSIAARVAVALAILALAALAVWR